MANRYYGWSRRWFGRFGGVWWNYDLTRGAAWTLKHLHRRGRFYGITIGQCAIGVVCFRKEDTDG